MSEQQSWNAARLIPTSGINGDQEQERRATSALLAVIAAVKEFGRAIVGPFGAPAGSLQTYVEVPFDLAGAKVFPDGLIRAQRGSKIWTALVEVKTGTNALAAEQLENYLDVAREHGFDALITISNEIPPTVGEHPTALDRRKLKKVAIHHLSWSEVLTRAVMQKEYRGVADPDQAWILGELIRYLEHPKSGALSFDDMGSSWVSARDAITSGTLRASDPGAADVASRFDALIRFACLRLGRSLGTEVTPVLSRAESADPQLRLAATRKSLTETGRLSAQIRIPNAVSLLSIDVDLRTTTITCSFEVDAPKQGRPLTRVNWVLRQLKDAPDSVRVETRSARAKAPHAALLRTARDNPAELIADATKEIKAFTIAQQHSMGSKRGLGRGSFIDSVLNAIDTTYAEVGQRLKPWAASPPKVREPEKIEVEPGIDAALSSTAFSSQDDEREPRG